MQLEVATSARSTWRSAVPLAVINLSLGGWLQTLTGAALAIVLKCLPTTLSS